MRRHLLARITLGASRLQEILADRTAALAYGASNLADALEHIVWAVERFNVVASTEIKHAYDLRRTVMNLYTLPESDTALKTLQAKVEQEMGRPTSPYDSHPAMKERLALIRALEPVAGGEKNSRPVWDLLPDAEALQRRMSYLLYQQATSRR